MDGKSILNLLWQRSEEAITALTNTFGTKLYRIAMNLPGSHQDAEDAVSGYIGHASGAEEDRLHFGSAFHFRHRQPGWPALFVGIVDQP